MSEVQPNLNSETNPSKTDPPQTNPDNSQNRSAKDLHAELTSMMGPIQWEWLKPHVQRDAVVIVNENLELAQVGVAIASNQTQTVERWISEQLITKPTAEQLTVWSSENKSFTSIIVQPFVLIQDKAYTPPEQVTEQTAEKTAETSADSSTDTAE